MKVQVMPETRVAGPRWLDADELAAWRGFTNLLRKLPVAPECRLQRDARLSFLAMVREELRTPRRHAEAVTARLDGPPSHRSAAAAAASLAHEGGRS